MLWFIPHFLVSWALQSKRMHRSTKNLLRLSLESSVQFDEQALHVLSKSEIQKSDWWRIIGVDAITAAIPEAGVCDEVIEDEEL
jgi:hypothetical protein